MPSHVFTVAFNYLLYKALQTKTIYVLVGALGLIKKGTQEEINKIPDAPSTPEIKKNSSNKHWPYPVRSFVH